MDPPSNRESFSSTPVSECSKLDSDMAPTSSDVPELTSEVAELSFRSEQQQQVSSNSTQMGFNEAVLSSDWTEASFDVPQRGSGSDLPLLSANFAQSSSEVPKSSLQVGQSRSDFAPSSSEVPKSSSNVGQSSLDFGSSSLYFGPSTSNFVPSSSQSVLPQTSTDLPESSFELPDSSFETPPSPAPPSPSYRVIPPTPGRDRAPQLLHPGTHWMPQRKSAGNLETQAKPIVTFLSQPRLNKSVSESTVYPKDSTTTLTMDSLNKLSRSISIETTDISFMFKIHDPRWVHSSEYRDLFRAKEKEGVEEAKREKEEDADNEEEEKEEEGNDDDDDEDEETPVPRAESEVSEPRPQSSGPTPEPHAGLFRRVVSRLGRARSAASSSNNNANRRTRSLLSLSTLLRRRNRTAPSDHSQVPHPTPISAPTTPCGEKKTPLLSYIGRAFKQPKRVSSELCLASSCKWSGTTSVPNLAILTREPETILAVGEEPIRGKRPPPPPPPPLLAHTLPPKRVPFTIHTGSGPLAIGTLGPHNTTDLQYRIRYLTYGTSAQLQQDYQKFLPWPTLSTEFRLRRKLKRFKRRARKLGHNLWNKSVNRLHKSLVRLGPKRSKEEEELGQGLSRGSSLTSLLNLIEEANKNLMKGNAENGGSEIANTPPRCPPRLKRAISSVHLSAQCDLETQRWKSRDMLDTYQIAFVEKQSGNANPMKANDDKCQMTVNDDATSVKSLESYFGSPGVSIEPDHSLNPGKMNGKILCVRSHFEINQGTVYLEDSDWEMCSEVSEDMASINGFDQECDKSEDGEVNGLDLVDLALSGNGQLDWNSLTTKVEQWKLANQSESNKVDLANSDSQNNLTEIKQQNIDHNKLTKNTKEINSNQAEKQFNNNGFLNLNHTELQNKQNGDLETTQISPKIKKPIIPDKLNIKSKQIKMNQDFNQTAEKQNSQNKCENAKYLQNNNLKTPQIQSEINPKIASNNSSNKQEKIDFKLVNDKQTTEINNQNHNGLSNKQSEKIAPNEMPIVKENSNITKEKSVKEESNFPIIDSNDEVEIIDIGVENETINTSSNNQIKNCTKSTDDQSILIEKPTQPNGKLNRELCKTKETKPLDSIDRFNQADYVSKQDILAAKLIASQRKFKCENLTQTPNESKNLMTNGNVEAKIENNTKTTPIYELAKPTQINPEPPKNNNNFKSNSNGIIAKMVTSFECEKMKNPPQNLYESLKKINKSPVCTKTSDESSDEIDVINNKLPVRLTCTERNSVSTLKRGKVKNVQFDEGTTVKRLAPITSPGSTLPKSTSGSHQSKQQTSHSSEVCLSKPLEKCGSPNPGVKPVTNQNQKCNNKTKIVENSQNVRKKKTKAPAPPPPRKLLPVNHNSAEGKKKEEAVIEELKHRLHSQTKSDKPHSPSVGFVSPLPSTKKISESTNGSVEPSTPSKGVNKSFFALLKKTVESKDAKESSGFMSYLKNNGNTNEKSETLDKSKISSSKDNSGGIFKSLLRKASKQPKCQELTLESYLKQSLTDSMPDQGALISTLLESQNPAAVEQSSLAIESMIRAMIQEQQSKQSDQNTLLLFALFQYSQQQQLRLWRDLQAAKESQPPPTSPNTELAPLLQSIQQLLHQNKEEQSQGPSTTKTSTEIPEEINDSPVLANVAECSNENRFVNKIVLNNSINQFNFNMNQDGSNGSSVTSPQIVNVINDNSSQSGSNQVNIEQQHHQRPQSDQVKVVSASVPRGEHRTVLEIKSNPPGKFGFIQTLRTQLERKRNKATWEKMRKQQQQRLCIVQSENEMGVTLANTSTLEIKNLCDSEPVPISKGGTLRRLFSASRSNSKQKMNISEPFPVGVESRFGTTCHRTPKRSTLARCHSERNFRSLVRLNEVIDEATSDQEEEEETENEITTRNIYYGSQMNLSGRSQRSIDRPPVVTFTLPRTFKPKNCASQIYGQRRPLRKTWFEEDEEEEDEDEECDNDHDDDDQSSNFTCTDEDNASTLVDEDSDEDEDDFCYLAKCKLNERYFRHWNSR